MIFFDKEFHSEYMPTRKEQCGYCYYLDLYETDGVKSYCPKRRSYCKLDETCGDWKDGGRSEMQLREHCTWHVSTMIGEILKMNIDEKPFSNIKKLREYLESNGNPFISLYDIYGPMIATNLFFDLDRETIAQSFMPILNQISNLVDDNNYPMAFGLYYKMIMTLYNRYNHLVMNESKVKKLK